MTKVEQERLKALEARVTYLEGLVRELAARPVIQMVPPFQVPVSPVNPLPPYSPFMPLTIKSGTEQGIN